ncbi:pilus assembly protein TadG-related protein [Demequina aurantiaca]|uniref:pilus assembly protein TadG-related protein n=1 Tax=Demequina aurantiaca TaxID=676200 RepID=UPI003D33C913
MTRNPRRDDGTIGLLTLGMTVLVLALILVVSAATTVHSEHMRLATIADELALDAADSADLDAYYSGAAADALANESGGVLLSQHRMETDVAERVASAGSRLAGIRVVRVDTPDGQTAVVTVGLTVHPMLGAEGILPFLSGIDLTATGTARAS